MKLRFSVSDLLVIGTLLGADLGLLRIAVVDTSLVWGLLALAVPTMTTAWIHIRLKMPLLRAAITHYGLSVAWAFFHGLAYCHMLNAQELSQPTHGRIMLPIPWAIDDMQEMAVAGIATTAFYALICGSCTALGKTVGNHHLRQATIHAT